MTNTATTLDWEIAYADGVSHASPAFATRDEAEAAARAAADAEGRAIVVEDADANTVATMLPCDQARLTPLGGWTWRVRAWVDGSEITETIILARDAETGETQEFTEEEAREDARTDADEAWDIDDNDVARLIRAKFGLAQSARVTFDG